MAIWVVDRIEGTVAILVRDEDMRQEDVAVALLPAGIGGGAVLRVPGGNRPVWAQAAVDEEMRQVRLCEADQALKRLRRRDPGGDIVL